MRLSAGLLWFMTLGAIALIAVVLIASTAPASCTKADRSRDAQILTQAQDAYAAILKDHPDSGCAADGLALVIDARCQRADMLASQQLAEDARKIYTSIVESDLPHWNSQSGVWCAISGLAPTPPPTPPPASPDSPAPAPSASAR